MCRTFDSAFVPDTSIWLCRQVLDDSEDDWDSGAQKGGRGRKQPAKKRRAAAQSSDAEDDDNGDEDELGAFDDGYGSDLMGDEEDRCVNLHVLSTRHCRNCESEGRHLSAAV